jgi:hypothetical protein
VDGEDSTVQGFAGQSNVLIGGTGNDHLIGNSGKNTYKWSLGDGNDVINDHAVSKNYHGQSGILQIGEGVNAANVTTARESNDLVLTIGESGEHLTVQNWYVNADYQLGTVEFADGNTWDRSTGQSIEAYFQERAELAAQAAEMEAAAELLSSPAADDFSFDMNSFMFDEPSEAAADGFVDPDPAGGEQMAAALNLAGDFGDQAVADVALASLQFESDNAMACSPENANYVEEHASALAVHADLTEENNSAA